MRLAEWLNGNWLAVTVGVVSVLLMVGVSQLVTLPQSNLGLGWQAWLTLAIALAAFFSQCPDLPWRLRLCSSAV